MPEKKIRVAMIAEDASNISASKAPDNHKVYINSNNDISVERPTLGVDWNIKDSIITKLGEKYPNNNDSIPQIYGFKINLDNSDPMTAMTYTNKNEGYTPISFTGLRSHVNYGSWETFIKDFMGCRPVAVYEDGTIYRYLNPEDYTKDVDGNPISTDAGYNIDAQGRVYDIMVEFKQRWYKIWQDQNDLCFNVANYKVDESYCSDAFMDPNGNIRKYLYVAAYVAAKRPIKKTGVNKLMSAFGANYCGEDMGAPYSWYNTGNRNKYKGYSEIQDILKQNNRYLFGYSHFIYLRFMAALVCKTLMIWYATGTLDPKGTAQALYNDMAMYNSGGTDHHPITGFFYNLENLVDTRNKGLFYIDKDVNDYIINHPTNEGKGCGIYQDKFFGIDMFLDSWQFPLFGLNLARKELFYKPNPPWVMSDTVTESCLQYRFQTIYMRYNWVRDNVKKFTSFNNVPIMDIKDDWWGEALATINTYMNSSFQYIYPYRADEFNSEEMQEEIGLHPQAQIGDKFVIGMQMWLGKWAFMNVQFYESISNIQGRIRFIRFNNETT